MTHDLSPWVDHMVELGEEQAPVVTHLLDQFAAEFRQFLLHYNIDLRVPAIHNAVLATMWWASVHDAEVVTPQNVQLDTEASRIAMQIAMCQTLKETVPCQ